MSIRSIVPEPVKNALRPLKERFVNKYESELDFWVGRLEADGGTFTNDHYRDVMLGIAGETDAAFLSGKVVADFGCGPRGSLQWIEDAALRIGIDVLADRYVDAFTSNFLKHNMLYVKSTEKVVPLPTASVDVMFTVNAIDHVDNFEAICDELYRVIKPGGEFLGSFNLEEPPTACEPQQLSEARIKTALLDRLEITNYRVARKGPPSDTYQYLREGDAEYQAGDEGCLWVRARKA